MNEWEWLEDSPMRKVKKPTESRGRVRFLDDDERQRFLSACVILALSNGMRQGELMGLKWPDVSLSDPARNQKWRKATCPFIRIGFIAAK